MRKSEVSDPVKRYQKKKIPLLIMFPTFLSKRTVCGKETLDSKVRAVERSLKCIRKQQGRWIEKNGSNINWYSSSELTKTGKFHTFLVSFTVLVSCAE